MEANPEGFYEFKMRKMTEKKTSGGGGDGMRDESLETSGEIQGLDWGDFSGGQPKMKRSTSKDSFTIMDDRDEVEGGGGREGAKGSTANGNVGKLKISSEMKEKLEAAMGSRKSSVRSTTKTRAELDLPGEGEEGDVPEQTVKKLNENRKMLLEQKLGGGGRLKKWDGVEEIHREVEKEKVAGGR